MPKWKVYGVASATKYLGEFDAETEGEAIRMGWESGECRIGSLCHQCGDKIDLGDIYEVQAETDEPIEEEPQ